MYEKKENDFFLTSLTSDGCELRRFSNKNVIKGLQITYFSTSILSLDPLEKINAKFIFLFDDTINVVQPRSDVKSLVKLKIFPS